MQQNNKHFKPSLKIKGYTIGYLLMRTLLVPYYIIVTPMLLCVIWGGWVKKNMNAIHHWVNDNLSEAPNNLEAQPKDFDEPEPNWENEDQTMV